MDSESLAQRKKNKTYPGLDRIILPVTVMLLIILVLAVFARWQKKAIVNNADFVADQMAETLVENIGVTIDFAQSSIKVVSDAVSKGMTSETLERPAETILSLVDNTPFQSIEYITADGMNIVNIGEAFDAKDRVYYQQGIKGHTGIWNNYNPRTLKETLINFYTPLMYDGKICGVLTGYIAANKQIVPKLNAKFFGTEVYGIILDENNMVICSNIDMDYVPNLSLAKLMDKVGSSDSDKQQAYEIIDNTSDDMLSFKNRVGEGRVCIKEIEETGWKVIVLVPPRSFSTVIGKTMKNAVIAISMVVLVLLLFRGVCNSDGDQKSQEDRSSQY